MAIIMAIPSCATARVLAYGCFRHCVASLPRVSAHAARIDHSMIIDYALLTLTQKWHMCRCNHHTSPISKFKIHVAQLTEEVVVG